MTQDLRGHTTPPNAPAAGKFHLMCTGCWHRHAEVKWSPRTKTNICQPKCPCKTN
jgi:hypothetical protein